LGRGKDEADAIVRFGPSAGVPLSARCGRLGDMMVDAEPVLPWYGLGGSFSGQRLQEGSGWDICTTLHLPDGTSDELTVGVFGMQNISKRITV
jgi:hypothetical protein